MNSNVTPIAASKWNITLIFSWETIFGNYILMCHSFMEIELKYKDQLLALKLSLINFWPLEFSLLWSVSIKFNTFPNTTRTYIVNATTSRNIQTRCDGHTGKSQLSVPYTVWYKFVIARIIVTSWRIAFEITMLNVYDRWNEIGWLNRT